MGKDGAAKAWLQTMRMQRYLVFTLSAICCRSINLDWFSFYKSSDSSSCW